MTKKTPPLLTSADLAAQLGVSITRVNVWRREGRIVPAMVLPSGQYLFWPDTARPEPIEPDRSRCGRKRKAVSKTQANHEAYP